MLAIYIVCGFVIITVVSIGIIAYIKALIDENRDNSTESNKKNVTVKCKRDDDLLNKNGKISEDNLLRMNKFMNFIQIKSDLPRAPSEEKVDINDVSFKNSLSQNEEVIILQKEINHKNAENEISNVQNKVKPSSFISSQISKTIVFYKILNLPEENQGTKKLVVKAIIELPQIDNPIVSKSLNLKPINIFEKNEELSKVVIINEKNKKLNISPLIFKPKPIWWPFLFNIEKNYKDDLKEIDSINCFIDR